MEEETIVLRLPPSIATRMSHRIDRSQQPSSASSSSLAKQSLRKKVNQRGGDKEASDMVIEAVWGEDGAPENDGQEADDAMDLDDVLEEEKDGEEEREEERERERKKKAKEAEDSQVDFWRVEGSEYVFRYGENEYYATLVNLPCVVECHKSMDHSSLYKATNVGQMLIVSDVLLSSGMPRPKIDQLDMYDGKFAHGLTPPMQRVGPDRFANVTPEARAKKENVTPDEIRRADDRLNELRAVIAPTVFMHEEIIEAQPWMEFADKRIVVEKDDDDFVSATKREISKAMASKQEIDGKKAAAMAKSVGAAVKALASAGAARPAATPVIPAATPVATAAMPVVPAAMPVVSAAMPVPASTPTPPVPVAASPVHSVALPAPRPPPPMPSVVTLTPLQKIDQDIASCRDKISKLEAFVSQAENKSLKDSKEQRLLKAKEELVSLLAQRDGLMML